MTRNLLERDGWLAISLPNVASWQGRIKFMLTGELWGFGEKNYRTQRHISPITLQQMVMMMQELGFKVMEADAVGAFSTGLMKVLTFPFWGLTTLLSGPSTLGECSVFLAQRSVPDADLAFPIDYRKLWDKNPAVLEENNQSKMFNQSH